MESARQLAPFDAGTLEAVIRTPSADEGQTLQAALKRTRWSLRFDPALERDFERETGYGRAKRVCLFYLLGIANFWVLCTLDLHKLSDARQTLENLRDGIVIVCAVLSLWQLTRLRRLSLLEREGFCAFSAFMMACYAAFEASQARDVVGVMLGHNILLVFVFVCLVGRLRFTSSLAVILPMLIIYPLTAATYDALSQAIVRAYVALFIGAAGVSLLGNYLLERYERRAYLMQRLLLLQRAQVQAGSEELRNLTLRDPLTGLANRRHFDSEIGRLFVGERPATAPVGLLQIDVDFFKRYNDCYGHPAGDVCLQKVGASLPEIARAHGGLAARIGGEEFAVLLPGLNVAATGAVAEAVCRAVRALSIAHSQSSTAPFVTVSVGVASMPAGSTAGPEALMQAADLALYQAKRDGRNRCVQADASQPGSATVGAVPIPALYSTEQSEPGPKLANALVEKWSLLLGGPLYKLRFPPDVEAAYQARHALRRQRGLAMLVFGGLTVTAGFVWHNLPLLADIAPEFMRGTLLLCAALALPWAAMLVRPITWCWREALFSATTVTLAMGLLMMESASASPGMQSGLISLSLITIVATVIAAPPMRYSLPSCVLLCAGMAVLTWLSGPADRERWLSALTLLLGTSIYSVVAAYLLDLSNRRAYVLHQLGKAQIAELQTINADLQRVALTDALTGLPNRRHFESQLALWWESCRSADTPLALLIIDIDHFKAYNDNYGHLAGDACLQSVGGFIAQWCARQPAMPGQAVAAFAARLGGEEFGVLMPGHSAPSALHAAERLRADLQDRRSPHAHSPVCDVLTASIGAACESPASSQDIHRLLRRADEALYRAKAEGRNRASV